MKRSILVAYLVVAGLVGGSVVVAQAQLASQPNVQVDPNLIVAVPNTVCLTGFAADPGIVSDVQTYQCASPIAVCKPDWVPGGMAVEAGRGGSSWFVYYCTPASLIPR